MFRFFRRHFRRLVALNRGPRYALGDVVRVKGDGWRDQDYEFVAIMDKQFVHRLSKYDPPINVWYYRVDGSDTWFQDKRIKLVEFEPEDDMTVCNG